MNATDEADASGEQRASDDHPDVDAEGSVEAPSMSRGALLRRLVVFQIKLAFDGLRDLFLSPIAIVVVLLGILGGGKRPDAGFRRLMKFGRRTDLWIDLFDLHAEQEREHRGRPAAAREGTSSASEVIDSVERIVREEMSSGGGLRGVDARLRRLRRGGGASTPTEDPGRDDPGAPRAS